MPSVGCLFLATVVVMTSAQFAEAHRSNDHPPDTIYRPGTENFNGRKIYLSPAHHWAGPNRGCGNYVEDNNMPKVAKDAATGDPGGDLTDRGYKVRVGAGDPDDNVRRSNAWGSTRHIALHSNAHGSQECGASWGGTKAFYYPGSTKGRNLGKRLKNKVGASSPRNRRHQLVLRIL